MNNMTVSLFMLGGDDFQNVFKSFELKYLQVDKFKEDPRTCFVMKDVRDQNEKQATICANNINLRPDLTIEQVKNDWIASI